MKVVERWKVDARRTRLGALIRVRLPAVAPPSEAWGPGDPGRAGLIKPHGASDEEGRGYR